MNLQVLDGYKTYILCAIGIVVLIANHFLGQVPGTPADNANWLNEVYALLLVASGRSAIKKV